MRLIIKRSTGHAVKNVVEEYPQMEYNDSIRKIFLYTGGSRGGSSALKSLLTYLLESVAENAVDEELQVLHSNVEHSLNRLPGRLPRTQSSACPI